MDNNNYQEPVQPTESQATLNDMQANSGDHSPGDMQAQQERAMFEKHVATNGVEIPENFKTSTDWFNSLKEAQGQYTQARQEISDLKTSYATEGVTNPNYKEPTQGQEVPVEEAPVDTGAEELRIQAPVSEPEPETVPGTITNELWSEWGTELAVAGDLSQETIARIKQTTGFTDTIINDFVTGQKAKMREAYDGAADLIGGRDKLANIFKWAETALSAEQQATINTGLSGPSYEVTLRGLEAMYNSSSVESVKAQEPTPMANTGQVAASEGGYTAYRTQREFKQDRNNPRFKMEPQYRAAVEQRMMRTDFNTLPM